MKKYILYAALATVGLLGNTSCSDFGDVNVDPEHFNDENMEFDLMFTNAQQQVLGSDWDVWRNGIIYGATMMQHVTSADWSQVFYTWSSDYNSAYWDAIYSGDRAAIRNIIIVLKQWENDPEHAVDYQLARIVKAYAFHRMTDLYGDIPYSEAGRPDEEIFYPKYDTQEFIYDDLLKELNEAQAALEGASDAEMGAADIYYGGDAQAWRKFANSLMLRVAMRLSKVDPAKAETWVKTAVNNGLFNSNDDNAMLQHPEGNVNNDASEPYAKIYCQSDPGKFYISEFFMNLLKSTNDPRLSLIATVCENPTAAYTSDAYDEGNSDPAIQVGMPIGYDLDGGRWDLSTAEGYPADGNWRAYYSTVNRTTYSDPSAPTMIITYAENCFLLAEAAYRGWLAGTSATGTAQSYYEDGVRAAMNQFSVYSNAIFQVNETLTADAIDEYLRNNPFDQSRALEQINTQYYINTFCDSYETFANWRRSGYPVLTPVDKGYPNAVTNGTIPRRFTYPTTESTVNEANYLEAVSRLNDGDAMTSRVWWDVE